MEGAPPESPTSLERKRGWRRRVPTALLVTVFGIALSAWLIPAFTRQWDDRQKARELQASIVTEMNRASAQVLTDGQSVLYKRFPTTTLSTGPMPPTVKSWFVSSLQLEARLSAYFPQSVVRAWREYTNLASAAVMLVYRRFDRALPTGNDNSPVAMLPRPSGALDIPEVKGALLAIGATWSAQNDYLGAKKTNLEAAFALGDRYRTVERDLLALEQEVTERVLAAHPAGYSTTRRDLLRDLLP